jgi:thiosulfate/3-mercaptopyruvate sulfurtransferase
MTDFSSKWLVETDWLQERLSAPGLVIIDAGLKMPADVADPYDAYQQGHIPGALFLDIDDLADKSIPLPHMLPPPEKFSSWMRKKGVGDGMKIVAYDSRGIFSSPRVWWMFRVMGHHDVAVLNGGLKKWNAEGRPLEPGLPAARSERHFSARKNSALVRDIGDVMAAIEAKRPQIADARAKGRFQGDEPELRPVPRLGHMPGACNVPYADLINADGTMKPAKALIAAFERAGINPEKPVITTCGTGVTACILALALAILGNEWAAVYDGSWAEWSNVPAAPVVRD